MAFFDFLKRGRSSSYDSPMREGSRDESADDELSPLERQLVELALRYGMTSDARLIDDLSALHDRAIVEVPEQRRMQLLLFLIERVEQRQLSTNSLLPFVYREPDPAVLSTAALHVACLWPGSESDAMLGVRELKALAERFIRDGEEERAAAVLAGLSQLGDRRVIDCIGPCWRLLSPAGRVRLAEFLSPRSYAAFVDWLVSWLEECEGDEFGSVAAKFSGVPEGKMPPEVIDVRRSIPIWIAPLDRAINVTGRWSFEDYGMKLRPRLLQLAADEPAPRIMFEVLKRWGIDHTKRVLDGVVMRPRVSMNGPRPLVPLLGLTSAESGILAQPVPLEDGDFVERSGQILVSWSIFNPHGPTWCCIGLLPTERPGIECLFSRMLHPFAQESFVHGVVRGDDLRSGDRVGRLVEHLFAREGEDPSDDEGLGLIGAGVPDTFDVLWDDAAFEAAMRRAVLRSPRLRLLDVGRAIHGIRAFDNPWDRVTHELGDFMKRMRHAGADAASPANGRATDAQLLEWLELVRAPEHWTREVLHFPSAWHGAIDHTTFDMGQTAYTFWQLDDFAARFGYGGFRMVARVMTEHAKR